MFRVELKKHRESAGLSQCKLAEKIGVSQATVGMWESGKREPNFDMLCRLADLFGVATDDLLGRSVTSAKSVTLPASDADLLLKFHALNAMARARILNALEFEYQAIPTEKAKSSRSLA